MPQLLVIIVFLLVSAPDLLGLAEGTPFASPWPSVWCTLTLQAALCVPAWVVTASCVRRVDRTGSMLAVRTGERAAMLLRWASVAVHAGAVLGLGWVASVRAIVGDVVLVDEVLSALPVLLVWAFSWWMIEPLERRLHEALLLRRLETGGTVYPVLSRGRFVWMTMRHQVLVLVVPMLVIMAWSETVQWWAHRGVAAEETETVHEDWKIAAAQLAGVLAAFVLTPALLVRIWDTAVLGPGPLRERIAALCVAARVRVREVLVWRTNGMVVNAAAVGMVRPLRYVLLSDALLDHLPARQVEAVAAHEIGHVRRRHMLWLGIVMLATLMGLGTVAEMAGEAGRRVPALAWIGALPEGIVFAALMAAAILVFGFVSRRFEWQADAFAVQCLSRDGDGGPVSRLVTEEAVSAMSGALGMVAALSGVARERFSWRHGSIAARQRRLTRLTGQDLGRLPIDRHARWIKVTAIAVIAGSLAWMAVGPGPS